MPGSGGAAAREGRLFIIGVGASARNCSHAVNDFRKLCGGDWNDVMANPEYCRPANVKVAC
jgi:hypothetical protein